MIRTPLSPRRQARRHSRLTVEQLEERCCPTTVTGFTTIPLPGVKAGDMVNITATLHVDDSSHTPFELGEGEPLIIQTSNGTYTISDYEDTHSITITAHADGESISAYIPGFDDDEFASITVDTTHKLLTATQRSLLNKAGIGVIALGVGLEEWGPIPQLKAAGVPIILGGLGLEYLGADPPDSNYAVIAQPTPPTLPPLSPGGGLTAQAANALNALITNEENLAGLTGALLTSLNRESGAELAHDAFWVAAQTQAVQQYAAETSALVGAGPALLAAAQSALQTAGLAPLTITPNDVINYEGTIVSNGLPADVVHTLTQLGTDPATIDHIRQLFIVQDADTVAGTYPAKLTDPALVSALQSVSQSLVTNSTDVTNSVQAVSSGLVYNRGTRLFYGNLTITNNGSTDLTGSLRVVLHGLPAGVTLANASGVTSTGDPYISIPVGALGLGQSVTVALQFNDPSFLPLGYTPSVFLDTFATS